MIKNDGIKDDKKFHRFSLFFINELRKLSKTKWFMAQNDVLILFYSILNEFFVFAAS